MTEFNFHILFIEYVANAHNVFMNIVSLLSGFLVVGYLVAHKLNALLSRVVVSIFSGATILLIVNLFFSWMDISAIASKIQKFGGDWHLANKSGGNVPLLMGIIFSTASVLGYVGALIFFFNQKKLGGKNE